MLDELGKLDPSSGVAPYRQITAWLYAVIRNATPGTRLPSNVALATHFGVARMTIRAAVAELAHDGLVVARQGSGVFVAGHGGPGSFEVAEAVRADLASSGRDQLPDAAVVAARHGVSDHVARRALDLLGSEGLGRDVRRKPKRVGPDAAELALTAACAVRISSVDLDERRETVWLRRAIRREPGAGWAEADLKTHQQRRIALDAETVAVLCQPHVQGALRQLTDGLPPRRPR
jgi:DNA-binding transcriptional regulator YhcF (GntR family)